MGEILVVEDLAPGAERLVGREDHGASTLVAVVDDVKEHVGGVSAVREVADFIHDEHRRVGVPNEGLREPTFPESAGELVDELGGGDEERVEAVLYGAVCDGDGEMGLA